MSHRGRTDGPDSGGSNEAIAISNPKRATNSGCLNLAIPAQQLKEPLALRFSQALQDLILATGRNVVRNQETLEEGWRATQVARGNVSKHCLAPMLISRYLDQACSLC
ncbi:hypothetical protein V2G26_013848 [Clonostachys chloroleuca]